MATLRKALRDVPRSVGFNIEIKYPLLESQQAHMFEPAEINTFLDKTLEDVYNFGEDRNIVFSSFHPDVCRMLALKQPNYPVLFLTSAGYDEVWCCNHLGKERGLNQLHSNTPLGWRLFCIGSQTYSDERTNSLRAALRFAQANSLLGIVSMARPFVQCPELVREVKAAGV